MHQLTVTSRLDGGVPPAGQTAWTPLTLVDARPELGPPTGYPATPAPRPAHQGEGLGERPRRGSAAVIVYVGTSSLLKLLIDEDGSERAELIWNSADVLASVALVVVEGRAALAAAQRGALLDARQHRRARQAFEILVGALSIVEVSEALIVDAADLAEAEALRGYDAVHLAAAVTVGATVFTSADSELCAAAQRRGLHIANPLSE